LEQLLTDQTKPNTPTQPTHSAANTPSTGGGPPGDQRIWYIVAVFFIALAMGAFGYAIGTSTEEENAEETLEAITEQAAEAQEEALATQRAAEETGTAIIEAYTATPAPTNTPSHTPTPDVASGQIAAVFAPVYSAPDEGLPAAERLPRGQAIEITGISEDGQLLEITYTNAEGEASSGYIPAEMVEFTGGPLDAIAVVAFPTSTPSPSQTPTVSPTLTTTPTLTPSSTFTPSHTPTPEIPQARILPLTAAVYAGADESYPVLEQLPQDTTVQISGLSEDGRWAEITYTGEGGQSRGGFVPTSAIQLTGGSIQGVAIAAYPSPTPIASPTLTSTPGPNPQQATATAMIQTATAAYIATASATPENPQASASGQFIVVRAGPSEFFNAVGIVDASNRLEITGLSTDGAWFRVPFEDSPTGEGWISAQVVFIAGDLGGLPIVEGPPLPVAVAEAEADGEAGEEAAETTDGFSAGSLTDVTPTNPPANRRIDYAAIGGLEGFAYQVLIVVDGIADGNTYRSTADAIYAITPDQMTERASIDLTGTFADQLEEASPGVSEALPVVFGTVEGSGYFYLGNAAGGQDECVALDEPDDELEGFAQFYVYPEFMDMLSRFEEEGVFGLIDENGLAGIPGRHYQLLGLGTPDDLIATDAVKVDAWWTPDEEILLGYRLVINSASPYFEQVATVDPALAEVDSFEGDITFHLLPLASGEEVTPLAAPPETCAQVLDLR
jgi:uncharacterized protein YraI